jgi:hypothetical protein
VIRVDNRSVPKDIFLSKEISRRRVKRRLTRLEAAENDLRQLIVMGVKDK